MELFPQIYKIYKLDKYIFFGRKKPGLVIRANLKTTETENAQGYDEGLVFLVLLLRCHIRLGFDLLSVV